MSCSHALNVLCGPYQQQAPGMGGRFAASATMVEDVAVHLASTLRAQPFIMMAPRLVLSVVKWMCQ